MGVSTGRSCRPCASRRGMASRPCMLPASEPGLDHAAPPPGDRSASRTWTGVRERPAGEPGTALLRVRSCPRDDKASITRTFSRSPTCTARWEPDQVYAVIDMVRSLWKTRSKGYEIQMGRRDEADPGRVPRPGAAMGVALIAIYLLLVGGSGPSPSRS